MEREFCQKQRKLRSNLICAAVSPKAQELVPVTLRNGSEIRAEKKGWGNVLFKKQVPPTRINATIKSSWGNFSCSTWQKTRGILSEESKTCFLGWTPGTIVGKTIMPRTGRLSKVYRLNAKKSLPCPLFGVSPQSFGSQIYTSQAEE